MPHMLSIHNHNRRNGSEQTGAMFDCADCTYSVCSRQMLQYHMSSEHMQGDMVGKCNVCQLQCRHQRALRDHERYAHTAKVCDVCDMSMGFSLSGNIWQHMLNSHLIRSDLDVFRCAICDKRIIRKGAFTQHFFRVHGPAAEQTVCCADCNTFSSDNKSHLARHLSTRHSDSPLTFDCDVCGQQFVGHIEALLTHKKLHISEPPKFVCSLCNWSTARHGKLQNHMFFLHLIPQRGDRDDDFLVCDLCRKRFLRKEDLVFHFHVHRASRNKYECVDCNYGSNKKTTLFLHMTAHLSGVLHQCDICGGKFKGEHGLRRHKRARHSNNEYVCDICEEHFFSFAELRKHVIHRNCCCKTNY